MRSFKGLLTLLAPAVVGSIAIALVQIMLYAEGLKIIQRGETAFGNRQDMVSVQAHGDNTPWKSKPT